jgi:hypothetical protein
MIYNCGDVEKIERYCGPCLEKEKETEREVQENTNFITPLLFLFLFPPVLVLCLLPELFILICE